MQRRFVQVWGLDHYFLSDPEQALNPVYRGLCTGSAGQFAEIFQMCAQPEPEGGGWQFHKIKAAFLRYGVHGWINPEALHPNARVEQWLVVQPMTLDPKWWPTQCFQLGFGKERHILKSALEQYFGGAISWRDVKEISASKTQRSSLVYSGEPLNVPEGIEADPTAFSLGMDYLYRYHRGGLGVEPGTGFEKCYRWAFRFNEQEIPTPPESERAFDHWPPTEEDEEEGARYFADDLFLDFVHVEFYQVAGSEFFVRPLLLEWVVFDPDSPGRAVESPQHLPRRVISLRERVTRHLVSELDQGFGDAGDFGRPGSNHLLICKSQGSTSEGGKYYIGPSLIGQREIYRAGVPSTLQQVRWSSVVVELVFDLPPYPDPNRELLQDDLVLLLGDGSGEFVEVGMPEGKGVPGEWVDYQQLETNRISTDRGWRQVLSATVPFDIFQAVLHPDFPDTEQRVAWDGSRYPIIDFGLEVRNPLLVGKLRVYGLNAYIALPASGTGPASPVSVPIPEYKGSLLSAEDVEKLKRPTAFQLFLDVFRPEVVAEAIHTRISDNRISDPSLESLELTETPWAREGQTQILTGEETLPFDGDACLQVTGGFGVFGQSFYIYEAEWGATWKIGGAIALARPPSVRISATPINIGLRIQFDTDDEYFALIDAREMIPMAWYFLWSTDFTVPNGATLATISSFSEVEGGVSVYDCIIAGPSATLDINDALIEPFALDIGSTIIPLSEFSQGSIESIMPGMTVEPMQDGVGMGKQVRVAEIISPLELNAIRVSENDIDWLSADSIRFYDEYKLWPKYQKLVDTGIPIDPQDLSVDRASQVAEIPSSEDIIMPPYSIVVEEEEEEPG